MDRQIIIGDIHGCYEELCRLLDKLNISNNDRLFFVGDYSDRGLQSRNVYNKLKEIKDSYEENCVLIYGNHEDMMINYSEGIDKNLWTHCNGGDKTLIAFNDDIEDYVDFIQNNTSLYHIDDMFNLCHASTLYEDIKRNNKDTLIWDRYVIDGGLYKGKLTVVGHTPVKCPFLSTKGDITYYDYDHEYDVQQTGIIGVDTGCVFGNKLTALIIEDNKMRFVNVKSNYNYLQGSDLV